MSSTSEAGSRRVAGTGPTSGGIRALCARPTPLRVALVALERPDGLLIERLLDAGLAVVAVHSNEVKATRAALQPLGLQERQL